MNKVPWGYCDRSWNPMAMKCTPIFPECNKCWHIRRAAMMTENPKMGEVLQKAYAGITDAVMVESRLKRPLSKRDPSVIATQFMGDLFHPKVGGIQAYRVWETMVKAHRHTFLVLTKRPSRMAKWYSEYWHAQGGQVAQNIWLGVTAGLQGTADEIIPLLFATPAVGYWLSAEPLLGPLNLRKWLIPPSVYGAWDEAAQRLPMMDRDEIPLHLQRPRGLNTVVVGAQTGFDARYMELKWAYEILNQCRMAQVPFFLKQVSACDDIPEDLWIRETAWEVLDG